MCRVTLKDSGKWKVNICADAEKTNCVEGEINLLVKGMVESKNMYRYRIKGRYTTVLINCTRKPEQE